MTKTTQKSKTRDPLAFTQTEKRIVTALKNDASDQRKNQYKYIGLLTVERYKAFDKAGKLYATKDASGKIIDPDEMVFHGSQKNSISNKVKTSIITFMVSEGYKAKVETYVSKCFADVWKKAENINLARPGNNGNPHLILEYTKIKNAIDPQGEGETATIIIDITSDDTETVKGDAKKYPGTVSTKHYQLNKRTNELVTNKKGEPKIVKVNDNVTSLDKVTNVASANKYIAHWEAQATNATNKVKAMQARLKTDARGSVRLTKSS